MALFNLAIARARLAASWLPRQLLSRAAYDLAAAALPKAGGTVTGDITIGSKRAFSLKAHQMMANETRLIGADPTADRTITLPNVTGTVLTT
jgi:hypothetical protein